jgi:hypothetical protein
MTTAYDVEHCGKHAEDRRKWIELDPQSDTAKRLVRPGIRLVQVGSAANQMRHQPSFMDDFRRIVGEQTKLIAEICASRENCGEAPPDTRCPKCRVERCPICGECKNISCTADQWCEERCTP